MGYRCGIDIGGTFTDLVLLDDDTGDLRLHKVLTTPEDPAAGAMTGLEELVAAHGRRIAECTTLVHGTTLVTNAVIERRGAATGLITTRGFRDILEMGREQRYDIYDLFLRYPDPLVPRRRRLEVDERVDRAGHEVRPLDEDGVLRCATSLAGAGVEAVAISFLHAYRNPAHELRAADLVREAFPALDVTTSSEVVAEIREFERTSTTVCNAYVRPLVDRYLRRLEGELRERGFHGRFYLMQSCGGLAAPDTARALPVRLLESGPAGGAMVAGFFGRSMGLEDVLAFDMGGTTAKICLVSGGRPDLAAEMEAARVHRFKRGSGLPIKVPVLDLMEIGAGGGSIAACSELGLLQVGPHSAGADPGPACYGQGGTEPTVTDACLALGYLAPGRFLGGAMRLDEAAAGTALSGLGRSLGIASADAAWGVYTVVCDSMASAARVHIIEKGRDPRSFPLIAFGGAGPLHAGRVARALGSPEVIVPPISGVASALGFLVAPASFEFSRSHPAEVRSLVWDEVAELYADLERQARARLLEAGVPGEQVRIERRAEMRLAGQFHDIEVAVPEGPLDETAAAGLVRGFEAEYEHLYHAVPRGYQPMVLNWRLRAFGPDPGVRLPGGGQAAGEGGGGEDGRVERPAYFPETGVVPTPVHDRYRLDAGARIEGPAIVEERESTTVVNPGDVLSVDGGGNLRIAIGRSA